MGSIDLTYSYVAPTLYTIEQQFMQLEESMNLSQKIIGVQYSDRKKYLEKDAGDEFRRYTPSKDSGKMASWTEIGNST